jgi:hypothetical protein
MAELYKLFPRLIVYLAPLLLVAGAAVGLAIHSGEAMPLAMIHAIQEEHPGVAYQPNGRDTIFAYKLMGVQRRRPEVIMIGSSRVLNFRSGLLTRMQTQFYNAGMSGMQLGEVAAFVNQLTPDTAPRILIVGIDRYWLNAAYNDSLEPSTLPTGQLPPELWLRLARGVIQELLSGRFSISELLAARNPSTGERALGLRAIKSGFGYTADGSRLRIHEARSPEEMAQMLQENGQTAKVIQPGDSISDAALATLEGMLDHADSLGITVVGVSLPLMPDVYNHLESSDRHGYLRQLSEALPALFAEHEQTYIDLSNPAPFDVTSDDMPDGTHPSDRLSARIFQEIVRAVPALLDYTDPEVLAALIADAAGPYEVFELP